jgi:hypothetical protein
MSKLGSMRGKKLALAFAGAVASLGLAASSFGSMLVDFKPLPVTANIPELEWTGTNLAAGAGAVGNADGGLAPSLQSPPGLQIEAPFDVPGAIPGKVSIGGGTSTAFYDVTLELSGLNANAAATSFGPLALQSFGTGHFRLLSTDPDAGGPLTSTTLLEGDITNGTITGLSPGTAGAVLSSTVTYTGGAIYSEFAANHGGQANGGTLSLSMLDIVPALGGTSIVPPNAFATLNAFSANATGLFSGVQVPEPASASIVLLSAVGLGLRRRTRKA